MILFHIFIGNPSKNYLSKKHNVVFLFFFFCILQNIFYITIVFIISYHFIPFLFLFFKFYWRFIEKLFAVETHHSFCLFYFYFYFFTLHVSITINHYITSSLIFDFSLRKWLKNSWRNWELENYYYKRSTTMIDIGITRS